MENGCAICKKIAKLDARLKKGSQSIIVSLCEECALRVSQKFAFEIIQFYKSDQKNTPDEQEAQITDAEETIEDFEAKIQALKSQKTELEKEIKDIRIDLSAQDFMLYRPLYKCATLEEYRSKLKACRNEQANMIRSGAVYRRSVIWHINGDVEAADKMIGSLNKLCISSFNTQCEYLISKVRFNNVDKIEDRIRICYDKLNDLLSPYGSCMVSAYCELKIKELYLCYEYAVKRKEQQDYAKEQREIARENAKVQQEIDEERSRIEKEQIHYQNRLAHLSAQLASERNIYIAQDIREKIEAVKIELMELDRALSEVNYREANQRAGYVYVISNIGAFGDGVYKIGMTRRLNPQDRIDELSNASVPFKFDVHAMIFSEDAPKLEAALHARFSNNRINMVNNRKEFFRVSLQEIEQAVKENFDNTVDFEYVPDAEQYRESMKIEKEILS